MSLRDRLSDSGLAAVLYRGSAAFLAIYVVGSAISFGIHLLIARIFGAASYGHFAYATSWMAILILACNIGLKPTVGTIRGPLRGSPRVGVAPGPFAHIDKMDY